MAERQQQQQMVHSVLVLQHEAMKSLSREFHQQVEAFVALSGEHPVTQEPHESRAGADPVALRVTPLGAASLVSDAIARLSKDTCDAQACVRDAVQMGEFLQRVPDTVKTDDDRVQVLFLLDLTLQRARKHRHSSSISNSTGANSAISSSISNGSAEDGRAMLKQFEQTQGYNMLADWFAEACTYPDDAKRQLTKLVLQVLLRNKPKLQFARAMVMQKLRRTQTFVHDKANKELVAQVIDKYKEGS